MLFCNQVTTKDEWIHTLTVCFILQEYGVIFMETSAKTGVNVDLAFMTAAKWALINVLTCILNGLGMN